MTYFRIIVRRGVPKINEDIRRRVEDPGQPVVALPEQPSECYLLVRSKGDLGDAVDYEDKRGEDFNNMDLSSFKKDNSRATFVRARVGLTNSAFVVGFVLESPSWGKVTVGMRAMSRIGGSYNLRKLGSCSHEPEDVRQVLSETRPRLDIYISAGPDPIFLPQLQTSVVTNPSSWKGILFCPAKGNVAGKWLALCLWQDQHKVVRVQHPRTCLQCIIPFTTETLQKNCGYGFYESEQRIFLL